MNTRTLLILLASLMLAQAGVDGQIDCDQPIICTDVYEPVCGSDGLTYPNACELTKAFCAGNSELTVASSGECVVEDPCASCTDVYEPVCGSNERTYTNQCELERDACQRHVHIAVFADGECPDCERCDTVAFQPVCGSDRITYGSFCELKHTACFYGLEVTLLHDGECSQNDACSDICTLEYAPVCGSDAVTYGNGCLFEYAKCTGLLKGVELQIAHEGECTVECATPVCAETYEPVCASNGITYPNMCLLESASCTLKIPLVVVAYGECDEEEDGVTLPNWEVLVTFDVDNNGICISEFSAFLASLNIEDWTDADTARLFDMIDVEQDGVISENNYAVAQNAGITTNVHHIETKTSNAEKLMIAGVVVATIGFALIIVGIVWQIYRCSRKQKRHERLVNEDEGLPEMAELE